MKGTLPTWWVFLYAMRFFMRIKTIGNPCFTPFAIVFTPYIFCLPINFAMKKFKNYNKLGSSTIINNTSTIMNLTHLL